MPALRVWNVGVNGAPLPPTPDTADFLPVHGVLRSSGLGASNDLDFTRCAHLPRMSQAVNRRSKLARLKEIVIDADNPAILARFWAEVVEGYSVRPYDEAEIARLGALGLTPETDPVVMVDGPGPTFCFHQRQGPRPFRNRLHIDLSATDRPSEVNRVIELGATFWRSEQNYTTLRDPEGNQFCISDAY